MASYEKIPKDLEIQNIQNPLDSKFKVVTGLAQINKSYSL